MRNFIQFILIGTYVAALVHSVVPHYHEMNAHHEAGHHHHADDSSQRENDAQGTISDFFGRVAHSPAAQSVVSANTNESARATGSALFCKAEKISLPQVWTCQKQEWVDPPAWPLASSFIFSSSLLRAPPVA